MATERVAESLVPRYATRSRLVIEPFEYEPRSIIVIAKLFRTVGMSPRSVLFIARYPRRVDVLNKKLPSLRKQRF